MILDKYFHSFTYFVYLFRGSWNATISSILKCCAKDGNMIGLKHFIFCITMLQKLDSELLFLKTYKNGLPKI